MAAAPFLLGIALARAIPSSFSQPAAGAQSGPRSGIENRSRGGIFLRRYPTDMPARASGPESGGGGSAAIASCHCGGFPRSGKELFARSSSGFLRLDVRRLTARRNGRAPPRRFAPRIAAEKTDLTNVAGTLFRIGKQGLEAGTKYVPESIPRPLAQAGVGLAGVMVASFVVRSLFSTLTFILAIGALSYAAYFFLTKGESSSSSGKGVDRDSRGSSGKPKSTDDALEEARKIMDKYK